MVYTIVRQSVADYEKWHTVFDGTEAKRREFSATGVHQIFRDVDDPNTITVIIEWENGEKAKEFLNSPILKEAAQKGGVIGVPMVRVAVTRM